MTAPLLWSPFFESSILFGVPLESARNEASKLGRLRRGSAWLFWFSFVGPLPVGVVFFLSLSFMGVVLFPSFVLGNASGEGGTFLVPLSLFSILLSLSLQRLGVVRAPWLGWILLPFQHLGECRGVVVLCDGRRHDLLEFDVPPVIVASAW